MLNALHNEILCFLSDTSCHELSFVHNKYTYTLIKSRFDNETDFIYLLTGYSDSNTHRVGGKADYAGIYSHVHKRWFNPDYEIRMLRLPNVADLSDVLAQLKALTTEIILKHVADGPIPETEEAESTWHDRDYFLNYGLNNEAEDCFFRRKTPLFTPMLNLENLTVEQTVMAINHPNEIAQELAEDYMTRSAKRINLRVWQVEQIEARLRQLEETPGEHHLRRQIAECVTDDMKTVNVQILKNGISQTLKSAACVFRQTRDGYYSDYHFDAPSRRAFRENFGRSAHLDPREIVRITYGRKVLFENNETAR